MALTPTQDHISTTHERTAGHPGRGKTIVLLHGFLASKKYWSKAGLLLSNLGYRVIAIDLLGYGNAKKPKDNRYDYDEHGQYISDAIARLNINGEIILAGHSMGALLAMRFVNEHPGVVSHLALINPPMYKDTHQAVTTLRATSISYRFLLDSRFRHVFWIMLRNIGPIANHTKYSREGSLSNVIHLACFFQDIDIVKIPTLLLIGKKDRAIYLDNFSQVEMHKNVNVVITETGHHAPRTDTELVVEHIVSFSS